MKVTEFLTIGKLSHLWLPTLVPDVKTTKCNQGIFCEILHEHCKLFSNKPIGFPRLASSYDISVCRIADNLLIPYLFLSRHKRVVSHSLALKMNSNSSHRPMKHHHRRITEFPVTSHN